MKKIIAALVCFFVLFTVGCKNYNYSEIDMNQNGKNISIGVIETKSNKKDSRIVFFDSDMKELGSLYLGYATMGNIFSNPLVVDNALYIIPQGYANKKDEKAVLEIDLSNLNVKKHLIDSLAMNSVAVSEKYVYTCNTLNGVSYINKCDKESGEIFNINMPSVYISKLLYNNERLYAFGTTSNDEYMTSELLTYDLSLNLIEKNDITDCGTAQYKAIAYGEYIFFTSSADKNDLPTSNVGIINTTDNSIDIIELNENYPLDLAMYNENLLISHFDITQLTGGAVSIYNTQTKEISRYSFEHGAEQMAVSNDKLYILSDWEIYVYDPDDMSLIKNVRINSMDNDFSYLSGIFVIKK